MRQGCACSYLLFCAIDGSLEHMQGLRGINVGKCKFTDLDYADDIALPASNVGDVSHSLGGHSSASRSIGLNVSWPKTKVQCFSSSTSSPSSTVDGEHVEYVDQFCYLGSTQDSSGRCRPDLLRRIGNASSSINSLSHVWAQANLSLHTKLRIYNTCIMPVFLYGSENWILLSADTNSLQAFHMRCQRRILGNSNGRTKFVTPRSVREPVSLTSRTLSCARRTALLGHVARLRGEGTGQSACFRISIDARSKHPPVTWLKTPWWQANRLLAQAPPELWCPHQRLVGQCSATRSRFAGIRNVPRRTSVHDDDDESVF